MEDCLKDQPENWYEKPNNVIGLPLHPVTGEFVTNGKSTMFYFVKGSEPIVYASTSK